jgi:hypothetical protein
MSKIPTIDSLRQEKSIKENSKIDIFNVVLNKCIEKIVYTNRHTDKTFVIFEVPKILIGYPMYDMNTCILFLINKLAQNNYMVHFIDPFYLYIDWGSANTRQPQGQARDSLKEQTRRLLQKFPDTSKVEYVYASSAKNKKKNKKK